MRNGSWEPQQLTIEPGFRGGGSATAAASVASVEDAAAASRLRQATDTPERQEARWSLSEECEPPREAGPWDAKAADIAAAARKAGVDKSFGIATADLSIGSADKSIIEQLAEYLFNLFDDDYQLGEECQVLAAFEERACLAFDTPIEDGFTFEQEALHREFCGLFDRMANGFLEARGVEEQELGEALCAALAEREGKPSEGNSDGTYTTLRYAPRILVELPSLLACAGRQQPTPLRRYPRRGCRCRRRRRCCLLYRTLRWHLKLKVGAS